MIYLKLFWAFFQIGLFSFGGGYATLPLAYQEIVVANAWLPPSVFNDLVTLSQMTPGPIAINAATFVGLRTAGMGGAIVATLGTILPSCIIVLALAIAYKKLKDMPLLKAIMQTLRPVVIMLIAAAGLNIIKAAFFADLNVGWAHVNWVAVVVFALCFVALQSKKISPIAVIFGSGAVYAILRLLF